MNQIRAHAWGQSRVWAIKKNTVWVLFPSLRVFGSGSYRESFRFLFPNSNLPKQRVQTSQVQCHSRRRKPHLYSSRNDWEPFQAAQEPSKAGTCTGFTFSSNFPSTRELVYLPTSNTGVRLPRQLQSKSPSFLPSFLLSFLPSFLAGVVFFSFFFFTVSRSSETIFSQTSARTGVGSVNRILQPDEKIFNSKLKLPTQLPAPSPPCPHAPRTPRTPLSLRRDRKPRSCPRTVQSAAFLLRLPAFN